MGAGTGDHGLGVVDAGILHAAGQQRGKDIRIVTASAANLEHSRIFDAGRGDGFGGNLEVEPWLAALHGGDQPAESALLSRYRMCGKPPAGRSRHAASLFAPAEHLIVAGGQNMTAQDRRCLDDTLADLPDDAGEPHRCARIASMTPRISAARWR